MTSSSSFSQESKRLAHTYPDGLRADALMEEDVAWSHEIDGDRDGDQFDRSERAALRRVAGLSTELEDVTEVEYRQLRLERVVLVGVWTSGTVRDAENSLAELAALAETAGALVLDGVIQRRDKPDAATFIGSGKASASSSTSGAGMLFVFTAALQMSAITQRSHSGRRALQT